MDGPWIGQLPQYSALPGNPYDPGYGPFLPRPSADFTAGAFAPFSPILPVPVDQPPPGAQRPQPRRRQYEVGANLPVGTPGTEGYNLASFQTLLSLGNLYSILRRCIQIRKQEIRALDWDIVLTKDAAKAYHNDKKAMRDFGERRDKARKWFRRPDPNYFTFSSWLDAMLDQVFVLDALSLYMCPVKARGMGKGLLGSDLDSLWLVDGQTIRPLTGMHGEYPAPPAPSAQQYLYGVPRSDYTQMVDGRDLQEYGITEAELAAELRSDQLLYLPFTQRAQTPYGFSLVEQCLIPVMTGLQKQAYQLSFFDESSVPRSYISPGDVSMTPNQIRELQLALNAVAGDLGNFFKVTVLPPGSKVIPQKEMQIVDQADEWIANEVAMTCGVRPTEIGVIPQVSTIASPFAAREMAQAQRSMHERVDTKPTLKFITEIFDTLIQVVCGQDDMRFLFSGMEEQADRSAAVDMGIKQIQSGALSIDEFRDSQGETPWGFPETSGPIVFTPMGPVPLYQAVANAQAQRQIGQAQQAETLSGAHAAAEGATGTRTPPKATGAAANRSGRPGSVTERQASRGGALAPFHATSTGAPGTATAGRTGKAALAELEALTRHLRKGRDVSTWEPVHLPGAVMASVEEDLAKGLTPDEVFMITAPALGPVVLPKARQQGQPPNRSQQQLVAKYAAQIQAAFAAAIAAAAALIAQWAAGTLAVTAAVLAAMIIDGIRQRLMRVLAWLWKAAWKAGAGSAGVPVSKKAMKAALEAFLATVGADWVALIARTGEAALLAAIRDALASGDPESVVALLNGILDVDLRADLIALTEVMRAWNAAQLEVMKAAGIAYKAWITMRDGKVCAKCLANQAQGAIPIAAPFKSGDLAPPGHPRCRCHIAGATTPGPGVNPPASKALRRQVDTNGQEFVGEAPPLEANPAGGGAAGPFPHRADGTIYEPAVPGGVPGATAGGGPPRWDGTEVEPHVLSLESGDDGAWGEAAGTGSPPRRDFPAPYMDGYWPQGGHGTGQAPATSIGAANGRPPNPVGKAADAAARFLKDAPPVKASVVYRQMLANFPASKLGWVKKIRWVGPVEIPTSLLDFANSREWAAHHQQAKVDAFARKIRAGQKVNPIIGIVKPGHNHVRIPDGRHRASAYRKAGQPAVAYVGFVDTPGKHPSDRVYLWQEHSGSSPSNKSAEPAEPYVAGLMVRAADTGRVLMLQRALSDEQEHAAGKLEPPGGHADVGETLMQAAVREFAEETGMQPPRGTLAGSWTSADGVYRGYVLDVPSEDALDIADGRDQVRNPDNPDGDVFEAILWVDPQDFARNPLMRPEMTRDLPQVMAALGGAVAKSAETPVLEVTPRILGPEGLWHTPDRHVGGKQKLPDYIEQVAGALMDQQGMGESEAIATAINAIKRWAEGDLHWGHGKVTPEVIAASRDALRQWEDLKASHH
jgi:8-oxo-dGTP pyrophosphatase MutT (NUDIX family)